MNKIFYKLLAVIVSSLVIISFIFLYYRGYNTAESHTGEFMWSLVWNDEFNGLFIDKSKWTFDLGNGFYNDDEYVPGWGNNEKQYYTDSNCYVRFGSLHIKAKEETTKAEINGEKIPFDYTSTRIKTDGLFSKKYGRFEIRAKLPAGKGLWPAIWLLPQNSEYGSWAASGEIDIMEAKGSDFLKVYGTIHYGSEWPSNRFSGESYEFPFTDPPKDITQWHVYALEWEPGELRWYVDGNLYQTQNLWSSNDNPYPAPFDKEFYLLMNLAVGGTYDGDPDDSTKFPATMEIDYVRIYELTGRKYREPVKPDPSEYMDSRPANARPALSDGNEVYNNEFSMNKSGVKNISGLKGSSYWYFLHLEAFGGDGEISFENIESKKYAKIEIAEPGNQFYSVQLIQDVPVVKGHTYKASFKAKAADTRKIMVKISGDQTRDWRSYSPVTVIELTPELKTYSINFTMPEESDLNARYEFNVGLDKSTVWIGEITLTDISPR
ncbi:MAG: family 16 glycosylhydrolase [Spirochaetes bacterium]|nr:family 16 glycosylhydrolase [Spirochaetota bacterium]MBN2772111.1 family 16 glycosylhydrolase [Spirochaetota bacterium]